MTMHRHWARTNQICFLAFILSLIFVPTSAVTEEYNPPIPSPDFTLKSSIKGEPGPNLSLNEQKGKVILLNFWASWCGPCRQEMPLLDDLHNKYEKLGFAVLGVNVEADPTKANEFLSGTPVNFPILYDTENKVSELYKVDAMPSTVMIDRDGMARVLHRGYQPGYEKIYEKEIKKLIRE